MYQAVCRTDWSSPGGGARLVRRPGRTTGFLAMKDSAQRRLWPSSAGRGAKGAARRTARRQFSSNSDPAGAGDDGAGHVAVGEDGEGDDGRALEALGDGPLGEGVGPERVDAGGGLAHVVGAAAVPRVDVDAVALTGAEGVRPSRGRSGRRSRARRGRGCRRCRGPRRRPRYPRGSSTGWRRPPARRRRGCRPACRARQRGQRGRPAAPGDTPGRRGRCRGGRSGGAVTHAQARGARAMPSVAPPRGRAVSPTPGGGSPAPSAPPRRLGVPLSRAPCDGSRSTEKLRRSGRLLSARPVGEEGELHRLAAGAPVLVGSPVEAPSARAGSGCARGGCAPRARGAARPRDRRGSSPGR